MIRNTAQHTLSGQWVREGFWEPLYLIELHIGDVLFFMVMLFFIGGVGGVSETCCALDQSYYDHDHDIVIFIIILILT